MPGKLMPAYSQVLDWNLEEGQKHHYHEQWPNHNEHLYSLQIRLVYLQRDVQPSLFSKQLYNQLCFVYVWVSFFLQYETRIDNSLEIRKSVFTTI